MRNIKCINYIPIIPDKKTNNIVTLSTCNNLIYFTIVIF